MLTGSSFSTALNVATAPNRSRSPLHLVASDGHLMTPEEDQDRDLSDKAAADELIDVVNELRNRLPMQSDLRVVLSGFAARLEHHRALPDEPPHTSQ